MPVKYRILSSHADAKPKTGTKTSNYPKGKKYKEGVTKHERAESRRYESRESKME